MSDPLLPSGISLGSGVAEDGGPTVMDGDAELRSWRRRIAINNCRNCPFERGGPCHCLMIP